MDFEQHLRASLVAPKPTAGFTARVLARIARAGARRRSRFVFGTVLVAAAAAAAMLAWRMSQVAAPAAGSAATLVAAGEAMVADTPVEPASVASSARVAVPVVAAPAPTAAADVSPRYSVLVMPLRQTSQDAVARAAAEALHTSMLEELRRVPGLTLHAPDESQPRAEDPMDFVLTLTSLATRVSQSGNVMVSSTDGGITYTDGGGFIASTGLGGGSAVLANSSGNAAGAAAALWVEMKVDSRRPAASRFVTMRGGADVVSGPGRCNDDGGQMQVSSGPVTAPGPAAGASATAQLQQARQLHMADCMTPAQLAAAQVEMLRLQVFPPDPAFQQHVLARLAESGGGEAGEARARLVLQALMSDRGSRLDAATIQALARYATAQPARLRRLVWSMFRWTPVTHPAAAAPLVETLRRDPDQQVRLIVLAALEASYSSNPMVRGALADIARDERDEVVRVALRRTLHGEAQWREEILAALARTDLPYEARLAPLLAGTPPVSPPQQAQRLAALREQQVLLPLVTLLRGQPEESLSAPATRAALNLLADIEDPAVFDLFMHLLGKTPALQRETTVRMGGRSIDWSGPVTTWIGKHREDPRVLAVLADVDPRFRAALEQGRNEAMTAAPAPEVEMAELPANLLERIRQVTEKRTPAPAPQ